MIKKSIFYCHWVFNSLNVHFVKIFKFCSEFLSWFCSSQDNILSLTWTLLFSSNYTMWYFYYIKKCFVVTKTVVQKLMQCCATSIIKAFCYSKSSVLQQSFYFLFFAVYWIESASKKYCSWNNDLWIRCLLDGKQKLYSCKKQSAKKIVQLANFLVFFHSVSCVKRASAWIWDVLMMQWGKEGGSRKARKSLCAILIRQSQPRIHSLNGFSREWVSGPITGSISQSSSLEYETFLALVHCHCTEQPIYAPFAISSDASGCKFLNAHSVIFNSFFYPRILVSFSLYLKI